MPIEVTNCRPPKIDPKIFKNSLRWGGGGDGEERLFGSCWIFWPRREQCPQLGPQIQEQPENKASKELFQFQFGTERTYPRTTSYYQIQGS